MEEAIVPGFRLNTGFQSTHVHIFASLICPEKTAQLILKCDVHGNTSTLAEARSNAYLL